MLLRCPNLTIPLCFKICFKEINVVITLGDKLKFYELSASFKEKSSTHAFSSQSLIWKAKSGENNFAINSPCSASYEHNKPGEEELGIVTCISRNAQGLAGDMIATESRDTEPLHVKSLTSG